MNFKVKSTDFTKKQISRIYHHCLDFWVDGLHGWGNDFFADTLGRELTDSEEAEVFLAIFKRFVDDGLILVCPPNKNEPTKKVQGQIFWNTSSDKMVEYIRSVFPSDIKYINSYPDDPDNDWIKFWYEKCPEIVWIDKRDRKIFIIGKIIKQNFKRKARKGRKIKFSPVEVKSK